MDYLEIKGGDKLSGEIRVSGAKNAALPILAATILAKNPARITNLPNVADIKTFLKLLNLLGGESQFDAENHTAIVDTRDLKFTTATYEIVKTMRASILALGPLLARFGECRVSLPGGCAIGQRPVDLHLKALEKMGAEIVISEGYIYAKAPTGGLKGATIVFDKITVTGSENIIMAAALARGETRIINAAKEPEVEQICEILKAAGVKIKGAGESEIVVQGTAGELVDFAAIDVISDRIETGTYLCAAAIANSPLTLTCAAPRHLTAVTDKLAEMGFGFDFTRDSISIKPAAEIRAANVVTSEYPGFPTDMQAQLMALATQANGASVIEERLFENRFMHVSELTRMGAKIALRGNTATVTGGGLIGADVMATDLRASSALVLAALAARGTSRVHRIYHLDRGYENLETKLRSIGAKIERKKEK
ncbi:MAG: UDP-N-acetylglucosamine 1-carboxyvinyltransferase [Helicobacteraceae bacterium]|jgi:UDP-N-acetylglucosamine 1-carboxyvinyltransferase|nr:UDP-N-acetylglucosamine 1-carboxyvinyltransferase [Helicobacteraceae bacterium]